MLCAWPVRPKKGQPSCMLSSALGVLYKVLTRKIFWKCNCTTLSIKRMCSFSFTFRNLTQYWSVFVKTNMSLLPPWEKMVLCYLVIHLLFILVVLFLVKSCGSRWKSIFHGIVFKRVLKTIISNVHSIFYAHSNQNHCILTI